MKSPEEAVHLSKLMVKIGKNLNKSIIAVITSMEQPLGRAIGNSLEVIEAIEFLKGRIETGDLAELTYYFASSALVFLDMYETRQEAEKYLHQAKIIFEAMKKFDTVELIITWCKKHYAIEI